jgi:ADP-ribose pyrophosphatase
MKPADLFRHCPQCGKPSPELGRAPFHCEACGFLFYFNPAIAVGAVVLAPDDTVLLIRRAKDPHKGKLSVPGGFVDAGEVAEVALRREIREEVGLEVKRLDYFCSLPQLPLSWRDLSGAGLLLRRARGFDDCASRSR